MKKLIPYILSYLIVTAGIFAFTHILKRNQASPYPPNSVTVITTLSHDELAAKLQQAGLPEAQHIQTMTVRHHPLMRLVFSLVFYACSFAAFSVFASLFQRLSQGDISNHNHAA